MLRSATRLIALAGACTLVGYPQEIAFEAFPDQMRRPMSDAVLYRLFLEHASAFEKQARLNEAQGRSGTALRNHLRRRCGITEDNLSRIAQVAVDFTDSLSQLRAEERRIAVRFRAETFQNDARIDLQFLPHLPPELLRIENQIEALSLSTRETNQSRSRPSRIRETERSSSP